MNFYSIRIERRGREEREPRKVKASVAVAARNAMEAIRMVHEMPSIEGEPRRRWKIVGFEELRRPA